MKIGWNWLVTDPLQDMRRMSSPSSIAGSATHDADMDQGEGGLQMNPMLDGSAPTGAPSSAFMESMRKARESGTWHAAHNSVDYAPRGRNTPGVKTKLVIITMLLLGIGLFIAGGTIYWDGDYGEDQRKHGLDMLACSALPLLPGLYGAVMWAGSVQGWAGYSMVRFNYDE